MDDAPAYLSGFGNQHATEALPGALPVGRNSPQRAAHGLFAELISGTAFTAPRATNLRTWTYRKRPSVQAGAFEALAHPTLRSGAKGGIVTPPEPLRWQPLSDSCAGDAPVDFVDGMHTWVVAGDEAMQSGMAAHIVVANRPMQRRAFVDADGEMLIVPQAGRLSIATEMGRLEVAPGEFALIPRGIAWSVELPDGWARAYVCENYGAPFRLPELGPIGSNGLANARDFLYPAAAFDDDSGEWEIVKKYAGTLWRSRYAGSPFNVVAWHGNLAPCKYDSARFMAIGSISHDHPDPSIFTVLTSPSDTPGTANCDFVIFPPRWLVAEDTFRPPWFHRNVMSEFMGLVYGTYDAKEEGFLPGGASLHNANVPHGPDSEAFDKASRVDLQPVRLDGTLAFMFESRWAFLPTEFAMHSSRTLQADYRAVWAGLTPPR
ncbi:MAG: homogentisate 1,2-dioxygenase [Pseudomonadota bacterium]|nr:homogentisate 1,2-dioxygenase [Pseudomonadota bacterium]